MTLINILVVDDLFALEIRDRFIQEYSVAGSGDVASIQVVDDFASAASEMVTEYEIAIFDYHDQVNNDDPGGQAARFYAAQHPDALVILKSAHTIGSRELELIQRRQTTIRTAQDRPGTSWDAELFKLVADWLLHGRAARTLRRRYQRLAGQLASDEAVRIAEAAKEIDDRWFEDARQGARRMTKHHLLSVLGRYLGGCSKVSLPDEGGQRMYLTVAVDVGRPWVPWEFLLFEGRCDLSTPISYVLPVPSRMGRPWSLKRVLYVYQAGLSPRTEEAAIREALLWTGTAVVVRAVPYAEFVDPLKTFDADVVHVAIHGPSAPDVTLSLAQVTPLREALVRSNAMLLILNACHGVHMLVDAQRSPYPFPVGHLGVLLNGCIDTVVTTQYALENVETPSIWCRAFYLALAVSGDAAISAGWARRAVAQTMQQFFELATIVLSRSGSPLVQT